MVHLSARQAATLMQLADTLAHSCDQQPLLQAEIATPMAQLLGVDFIGIAFWNADKNSYEDAFCYGRSHEMSEQYERYFQRLDPIGALRRKVDENPRHLYQDIAHSDLKTTEYFNDFLKRFGTTEGINASLFDGHRYVTDIRFWRGPSKMLLGETECCMVGLLKPYLQDTLIRYHRLRSINAGQQISDHRPVLTAREASIAKLLRCGFSDKQLARELDLSFWTIRTHIAKMMEKTGASNRTQLALLLS